MKSEYDAVVIGSGPNGLSAGIALAKEGWSVLVVEKQATPGGGTRTEEGPSPGFFHDVCSAVYPMALCSSFFQALNLEKFGLEWIHPEIPLAHPLEEGREVCLNQSIDETAAQFSDKDQIRYQNLFQSLLDSSETLFEDLMAPPSIPSNPIAVARFGLTILPSANHFIDRFSGEDAKALFAGNIAHSILPFDRFMTPNAIGLMLMLACHKAGWPIARGGAVSLSKALCQCLSHYGGDIKCDTEVNSIDELPKAKAYLFDTGPHALARIAGSRLPPDFVKRLLKYRYGPGVFKIDYALSEPVPWESERCRKAGTVHVGGTANEIAASEAANWNGIHSEKPFVLTAQPSLFDSSRAPHGNHTFWAYCHVPANSTFDMTQALEAQIERFAPGFRDTIIERKTRTCEDFERYNPNLVGGDIIGGVTDWKQLLTRPTARLKPHATPAKDIYLCSASTPPGAGVHGMCGYSAAKNAIARFT